MKFDKYSQEYVLKNYYKTGSMIALGCRGIGIILNKDIEFQWILFDFGAYLGLTF